MMKHTHGFCSGLPHIKDTTSMFGPCVRHLFRTDAIVRTELPLQV